MELTELPAEPITVRVWRPRGGDLPESAIEPVPAQVVPEGQEIVLRFRPGRVVEGTVVDAAGNPVPVADVKGTTNHGQDIIARTDFQGRFRVVLLPDSRVDLRVRVRRARSRGGGYRSAVYKDVTDRAENIVIRLGD